MPRLAIPSSKLYQTCSNMLQPCNMIQTYSNYESAWSLDYQPTQDSSRMPCSHSACSVILGLVTRWWRTSTSSPANRQKSGQISQCDPCRATFVQLDLQGEPPHSHNLWMVKRCHKSSTGTIFVPTFLQNPWRSKIAFQIQNPRKITSVPEVKVQQQKLC